MESIRWIKPDSIEAAKKEGLEAIRAICKFKDEHDGKNPSSLSKDIKEVKMGIKLHILKMAKRGKGSWEWNAEYLIEAKKLGYHDLFDMINRLAEGLQAIRVICRFIDDNGKNPSEYSKDIKEKRLGQKLSNIKKAKQGKGGRWFPEYNKEAKKLGYPELFKVRKLV